MAFGLLALAFLAGIVVPAITASPSGTNPAPFLTPADDGILRIETSDPMIIDHRHADLADVPLRWIDAAKRDLHIAYGHTSHGSQITTGMTGLTRFANAPHGGSTYAWNNGGTGGALDLADTPFSGAYDLGAPSWTAWEAETRAYLAGHPEINVVIWSWCGEVTYATEANIDTYLSLMNGLENDYPEVSFVYMTGHLDGYTYGTNPFIRNQQIRDYCLANDKILYDFNDIESYDPDGNYYADKRADDGCNYDSDGDGIRESNWAIDWQNAHPGEWYECDPDHTQPLNGNLKAYAAWWLWARLGGWDGGSTVIPTPTIVASLPPLLGWGAP